MQTKPRLLLIGHTYMIRVNREKALHLATHFNVRVCTSDFEGWKVLGQEVTDVNPPEHESAYKLRRLRRWPRWQDYTKIAFKGLQSEIADFRPDIILVENEPWSILRWQARWASWWAAPKANFVEFTWENVARPGLKGSLVKLIYQATAATGGQVICGNKAAQDLCIAAGFPKNESIVAAQLGISMENHPSATEAERASWRTDLGWSPNVKVLGFCGRLVEEKGLKELVEAAESLRGEYPELRLVIVGEGILRKYLETVDPKCEWLKVLPPVRHEAIPAFLNKLDIFILPSKPLKGSSGQVWEEQFGHVLIEAMACGILTLGSDSGAIPEVLNDSSVTFLHSDPIQLAATIRFWLEDDHRRKSKADSQRNNCIQKWTHESVAQTYASFLNSDFLQKFS
jgi:L-malate glycosyltransferase